MKFNYSSAIMAAIAAIIIFCVIAVVFNVMPVDALPVNFIGATLGALIGALITLVLLRGQTAIEEQKGKDIRILEKKTEIFQDFIKDVWKVWEDQKITIEEFQNLTSQYYQNLMIYLKDDPLKNVGNALSVMGGKIDKKTYEDTKELRKNIVEIINTLSAEIDLGGKIDEDIMDQHDKIVFQLLLKNSILEAVNAVLPTDTILEKGKYEFFREGSWTLEFLCFNFTQHKGCKIVIGPLTNPKSIEFTLIVDRSLHQFDSFRDQRSAYSQRIKDSTRALKNPIKDKDFEELDILSPKLDFLDFANANSLEKIRTTTNRETFASELAQKINYWFSKIKIENDDIVSFLDKYMKNVAAAQG